MARTFTGRQVMGAIGNPVVLITAAHQGQRGIMTINMIAGISFNPPLIGVSLSHHSHTASLIQKSGEFAVNVISPAHLDLAKKIGASTGHKIDKFKEFAIDTVNGEEVASPLVIIAHTVLECKVNKIEDIGNHSFYIAQVVAFKKTEDDDPLYLYHGRYYAIGEQIGTF